MVALCLAEQNHLSYLCSAYYEEHFCEIILNLDWHVVQEEIPFIFYQELWWPSCLAEENHLDNFGTRHYEEYFCKICLNLDQWFRREM